MGRKYNTEARSIREPILTYLMPLSQLLSWFLMFREHQAANGWLLPVSALYWLWAAKNWLVGPLKQDAGILTFAVPLAAELLPLSDRVGAIGCALVTINFALPLSRFVAVPSDVRYEKLARKVGKSVFWSKVFYAYMISSVAFWSVGTVLMLTN